MRFSPTGCRRNPRPPTPLAPMHSLKKFRDAFLSTPAHLGHWQGNVSSPQLSKQIQHTGSCGRGRGTPFETWSDTGRAHEHALKITISSIHTRPDVHRQPCRGCPAPGLAGPQTLSSPSLPSPLATSTSGQLVSVCTRSSSLHSWSPPKTLASSGPSMTNSRGVGFRTGMPRTRERTQNDTQPPFGRKI